MCNLYFVTTNTEAIRALVRGFEIARDIGNFEPMPAVFPDFSAPIVRNWGAQGEGRPGNDGRIRIPNDRSQRRRASGTSESDAGHSHDDRQGRGLADPAMGKCKRAAEAAARRRASNRGAWRQERRIYRRKYRSYALRSMLKELAISPKLHSAA